MTAVERLLRPCGMTNGLRVLDAARMVVDEIQELCDHSRPRLLHMSQLQEASESIVANIREGWQRIGKDRNRFMRYALTSAEETAEHLRTNFRARRLTSQQYWPLHQRLLAIRKMIERLMSE